MARYIAALCLTLTLVTPAAADEAYTLTPLGQQWYVLTRTDLLTLAPGEARRVIFYLDDVPGGVAGAPVVVARPLNRDQVGYTLSPAVFAPVGGTPYYPVPLVAVIVRNDSAEVVSYHMKAYVLGRE